MLSWAYLASVGVEGGIIAVDAGRLGRRHVIPRHGHRSVHGIHGNAAVSRFQLFPLVHRPHPYHHPHIFNGWSDQLRILKNKKQKWTRPLPTRAQEHVTFAVNQSPVRSYYVVNAYDNEWPWNAKYVMTHFYTPKIIITLPVLKLSINMRK